MPREAASATAARTWWRRPRGWEAVAEMRRREAGLLAEVAEEIGAERIAAAATLSELAGLLERGESHLSLSHCERPRIMRVRAPE